MGRKVVGHWADQAAELGGASALAIGCGVSAWLLRSIFPVTDFALVVTAAVSGGILGWLFVWNAGSSPAAGALKSFKLEALPLSDVDEGGELLLDNPVIARPAPSRVVSLFGGGEDALPTAGELERRIDRHLGAHAIPNQSGPQTVPDASDALFEALGDLRRSLRRQ